MNYFTWIFTFYLEIYSKMDSEMVDLNIKNEPLQLTEENQNTSNQGNLSVEEMYHDEDDPVVKELDVYLSRSLADNIYILQVFLKTFRFKRWQVTSFLIYVSIQ